MLAVNIINKNKDKREGCRKGEVEFLKNELKLEGVGLNDVYSIRKYIEKIKKEKDNCTYGKFKMIWVLAVAGVTMLLYAAINMKYAHNYAINLKYIIASVVILIIAVIEEWCIVSIIYDIKNKKSNYYQWLLDDLKKIAIEVERTENR